MTNIRRKYLITFTFNVYFGSLWHDRNRSQRLEKIEESILTSSFSQDFISVASSDDLFQIVNIRHLIIENHLIYSCFMMQHRINCPRTASESISVDILHADSSNKVWAALLPQQVQSKEAWLTRECSVTCMLWNETKCWCADHQGCVGHAPCQHPLRRPPESWTIIAIIRFNSIWRTM